MDDQTVEECDATMLNQSTTAGTITAINQELKNLLF